MAQQTKDELIQELIEIVKAEKAEIEKINKPTWETNCVFTQPDGKITNIRTISTIEKVQELFGMILNAKNIFDESLKLLNINKDNYSFKYNNFTFDQWTNDFKNIAGQITMKEKLQDLATKEARLDKLVSKEKREELELLDLLKQIKG